MKKFIFPLALIVLALDISTAIAETALEEITVTARTRAESIQDIPIAISAFTTDDFEKRGIEGLDDVARFTSGFTFEDFGGGFGTPVLRGAAQTQLTAIEANVSTFYDGIYMPRSWAINTGVSSLSRIEVVKGPQSARYGRNAFMGAVNLIPYQPTEECEGSVELTYGTDDRFDAKGTVGGPLIEGLLNARASVVTSSFDGSWENDHPFASSDLGNKGTSDNAGGWDNTSYSLAFDLTPSDRVTVGLAYHNFDLREESRGGGRLDENSGALTCGSDTNLGGPAQRLFCGEIPGPDDQIAVDPRSFGRQAEVEIIKANFEFQISDLVTASYVFGNVKGDIDIASLSEVDPVNCAVGFRDPGCNFSNTPVGSMDYDSHELRFAGDVGNINWVLGAYVSEGVDDTDFAVPNLPQLTSAPTQAIDNSTANPDLSLLRDITTMTDVSAIFGEFGMSLSENTRMALEVRYSEEEKTQVNNANGDSFNDTYDNFAPRLSIETDLSDHNLIYASIAQGTKAGGFNPTAADPLEQTYGEEQNWTLEFGSKNTLWNDRLQLNAAIYAIKWSDIQLNAADQQGMGSPSANIILNLGDATTYGFELDAIAQLSDNFQLNATLSYADATYDDGTIDNRFARDINFGPFFNNPASCDDITCPANGDISGNQVERQAPLQISVGGEFNTYLEGLESDLYIRADIAHQSEQEAESMNLSQIEGRTILNASAGMSFGDVDVRLWARNLTDEVYNSNAFVVLIPFGNSYANIFGERRTVGLTAKYSF